MSGGGLEVIQRTSSISLLGMISFCQSETRNTSMWIVFDSLPAAGASNEPKWLRCFSWTSILSSSFSSLTKVCFGVSLPSRLPPGAMRKSFPLERVIRNFLSLIRIPPTLEMSCIVVSRYIQY